MTEPPPDELVPLKARCGFWLVANVLNLDGQVPWVPIVSALLTLSPSLFRALSAAYAARLRNRDLARELVKARAENDRLRTLYVDGRD